VNDLLVSFVTVFIAEIGDKSQLVVIAMSVVLSRRQVLAGVAISAAASQTLSVALGATFGDLVSERAALIVGGIAFLGFGIWAGLERTTDDPSGSRFTGTGIVVVASTVFLAELGDKTMFATAALAATSNPVATWLGSFLALLGAAGVALIAGSHLLARVPKPYLRWITVGLFVLIGLVMGARGVWG
jgi:putative Ca2+/H+ antiporter (TMEM165/GDT1 family)